MNDDDYNSTAYFESLDDYGQDYTNNNDQYQRLSGLRAFATTPPGGRRGATSYDRNNRATYWQSNGPIYDISEWNSVKAKLPKVPPITEPAHIKTICLNQLTTKVKEASG